MNRAQLEEILPLIPRDATALHIKGHYAKEVSFTTRHPIFALSERLRVVPYPACYQERSPGYRYAISAIQEETQT
jgi:hypothetical protein